MGVFDPGVFDPGVFDAGGSVPGSFTADAVIRRSQSGSLASDAVILASSGALAFTADAVIRRTLSDSTAADAVILTTASDSVTTDAILLGAVSLGFPSDAWVAEFTVYSDSFPADAIFVPVGLTWGEWSAIWSNPLTISGTFTADAWIAQTVQNGLYADATLLATTETAFAANAVLMASGAGSVDADAVVLASSGTLTFTADSRVSGPVFGSFPADAVLLAGSGTKTFAADARIGSPGGSLTADATLLGVGGDSFPASAWIVYTQADAFGADAYIYNPLVTGTFTADANIRALNSFTANAIIVPPEGSPGGGKPGRVSVWINGLNFTDHVLWATAEFNAKVNGTPGGCTVQIVDRNHEFSFTFGQEIYLNIDGVLRWGGWIMRPERTFPMSVMPNPVVEPRIWTLVGTDFNLIFDRRIVHDLDHPAREWKYAPGTYDDTIINDIWKYLDMEGFTKHIERVAVAILDIAGVTTRSNGGTVASGGYTFRDVILGVSRNTAAIFYCTPEKVITYVDSDTANVPYTLTDKPYAYPGYSPPADAIGYRQMKVREDNTNMVNDALIWGAGYGSQNRVFSRNEALASQTKHGRWQAGKLASGVYKQATADALAASFVDGSPSAHRAQKKPKWSVSLVTQDPSLNVGDVVEFECSQFDLTDMPTPLPVREQTITFPTDDDPRFELMLSWEIDAAWSFQDPWRQPRAETPPCDGCGPGPGSGGDPPPPECTDAICGITDTFTRTQSGWGTSDAGLVWTASGGNAVMTVDGSSGVFTWGGTCTAGTSMLLPVINKGFEDHTYEAKFRFSRMPYYGSPYDSTPILAISIGVSNDIGIQVAITPTTGTSKIWVQGGDGVGTWSTAIDPTYWEAGTWYIAKYEVSGSTCSGKVWKASETEPASMVSDTFEPGNNIPGLTATTSVRFNAAYYNSDDTLNEVLEVDYIDITGVSRCTAANFDDFNRTVASGWGTATPGGLTWTMPGSGAWSVDGSQGVVTVTSSNAGAYVTDADGPWTLPDVTLEVTFSIANAPTSINDTSWLNVNFQMAASVQMAITDGPPITGLPKSYIACAGQVEFIPHGYWVSSGSYTLTVERTGGQRRASISNGSTTYTTEWGTDSLTSSAFGIGPNINSGSQTFRIDSISFTYDGMPCYPCGFGPLNVVDDFSRTLSKELGTSSSGYAWENVSAATATGVDWGVNGSSLWIYGGTVTGGWLYGSIVGHPGFEASNFVTTMDFKFSKTRQPGDVSESLQCEVFGDLQGLQVILSIADGGTYPGLISLSHWDDNGDTTLFYDSVSKTDWAVDTWYTVKLSSINGVKVWPTGSAEPESWDIAYAAPSFDRHTFRMRPQMPKYGYMYLDNLLVTECPLPVSGAAVAVGDKCCDELVALSGPPYPAGTEWQTTQASYIPGSTKLAVNGIFRFGDYSETDPASGIITANISIDTGDVVTLCYLANGPLP